jgi:hypothetical protein
MKESGMDILRGRKRQRRVIRPLQRHHDGVRHAVSNLSCALYLRALIFSGAGEQIRLSLFYFR